MCHFSFIICQVILQNDKFYKLTVTQITGTSTHLLHQIVNYNIKARDFLLGTCRAKLWLLIEWSNPHLQSCMT
ncbi:hypothetical protein BpHYR1_051584 [Brachionus plicatilis]|uniref:Uncharacterized protein n=1 Tax=Brachionus plicatilis TaxID=10195 RepID=A0A3M7PQP6_BRAPC|nr:hypothetical protein BpHYR1_051584 [Brachionus plicatilis]